jgi:hypothetical protein
MPVVTNVHERVIPASVDAVGEGSDVTKTYGAFSIVVTSPSCIRVAWSMRRFIGFSR